MEPADRTRLLSDMEEMPAAQRASLRRMSHTLAARLDVDTVDGLEILCQIGKLMLERKTNERK